MKKKIMLIYAHVMDLNYIKNKKNFQNFDPRELGRHMENLPKVTCKNHGTLGYLKFSTNLTDGSYKFFLDQTIVIHQ